jgi:hypothetical protein
MSEKGKGLLLAIAEPMKGKGGHKEPDADDYAPNAGSVAGAQALLAALGVDGDAEAVARAICNIIDSHEGGKASEGEPDEDDYA